MKVSIITACYNSEATIIDTLKSLQCQSYHNIEYIVIDGASKDNTVEVIKSNCTRVTKIISEPDRGIYDALNKGIATATGDIIGFLHSDDLFASPHIVQNIVDSFKQHNVDAVYGDLEYVDKKDTSKIVRLWHSGHYNKNQLINGWMPPHPTFYMKRKMYSKLGFFDLNFKISADYDSILRYLWTNEITLAYIPSVLIKMRIGGASNRSLKNIYSKSQEDILALKKNGIFWPRALLLKNLRKTTQFFMR